MDFIYLSKYWGVEESWRTLAWSNAENGLRESQFSCVRSYPPQRTHHVPSLCQGPSERQISGWRWRQKLASGVAHTQGDERVLHVKLRCGIMGGSPRELRGQAGSVSSAAEHVQGGCAEHRSVCLCSEMR